MAADTTPVGFRFGREDIEPARKRTPLTAVVQSELDRILAAITEREPVEKILNYLGLSSEIPIVEKARPPPQSELVFEELC